MKKILGIVILATISGGFLLAQTARTPEVLFKAAQNKELVEGDLKGAIEQYKQIAAGKDRAIAAKALLAMAECYQKLGDAEAQTIYERILRDFADQTEAVSVARAHLGSAGAGTTSVGMTSRRIWTPPPGSFYGDGAVSPNERFLTYTDWSSGSGGDLMVRDLATGRDRVVSTDRTNIFDYPPGAVISRDSKQVTYSWFRGRINRSELRLATAEGAGPLRSRLLFTNDDISGLNPYDWSPDGNWIAVQLERNDHTDQMGLISVRDGSLHVLKSADWLGAHKLFFSPDGKYLGFDAPVGNNRNDQRDVFILAVDGSREMPVAVGPSNDTMMGWSPDGKYLLFASDRGTGTGLWAVPVADGKPQGPPELLKPDISRFSVGVSTSGNLYSRVVIGGSDIQVATVDFGTGKLLSGPVRPAHSFLGFDNNPKWSPDGKYLSYDSDRGRMGGQPVLSIWSAGTGQIREIQPRLNGWGGNVTWAPDGRSLIARGRDLKNREGVFRIDAQTGEATPILMSEPNSVFGNPQFSPDGKRLYYQAARNTDVVNRVFIVRDLASGNEREIIRRPVRDNARQTFSLNLSPDGRFIATTYNDESTKSSVALLIPVSGGEPRELLRVREPQVLLGTASWMPDGRAFVVNKVLKAGENERELWLVPVDGSQPRKIDVGTINVPGPAASPAVSVNPDGRRIAYATGSPEKSEVWVLENFLPALSAKK
jgi:Tol biopolymer transport system component